MGIIAQTLIASRFTFGTGKIETIRNHIACRVFNSASHWQDHQKVLKELNDIKHGMGENRTSLAHPRIFVSDLRKFMKTVNPSPSPIFRSMLAELETMEVWRDDKKERLFADSTLCS